MKGYKAEMEKNIPVIEKFLAENGFKDKREIEIVDIVVYVSGVKLEWNILKGKIVIGYENSEKDRENLKKLIVDHFGEKALSGRNIDHIGFCENPTVDQFKETFELLRNLPFKIEVPSMSRRGEVIHSNNGIFLTMAKVIKMAVDNNAPFLLNRKSIGMDAIDEMIIIGESINRTPENSYREHIVPCDFITREAVEMFREGKSITDVASMIKSNLSIVLITNEEAEKLDIELKLRTTMPEGWKIGDDIFARLKAANILLK